MHSAKQVTTRLDSVMKKSLLCAWACTLLSGCATLGENIPDQDNPICTKYMGEYTKLQGQKLESDKTVAGLEKDAVEMTKLKSDFLDNTPPSERNQEQIELATTIDGFFESYETNRKARDRFTKSFNSIEQALKDEGCI